MPSFAKKLAVNHIDRNFHDAYTIEEIIGEGSMGSVAHVTKNSTGKSYAMKTIMFNNITKEMRTELVNEIQIMKMLDHPGVIRLIETFEEKRRLYLVMELCVGGDLYSRTYNEVAAKNVAKKLLSAIAYCHSRSIIHRDLKFENILYVNNELDSELKIIDFGLSRVCDQSDVIKKAVGTIYSMAPEVLEGRYSHQADLWSIGVILYMLMAGRLPFEGEDEKEVRQKIIAAEIDFSGDKWASVSVEAMALVKGLLTPDLGKRWTATQALDSPWLQSLTDSLEIDSREQQAILDSMRRFGR
jgi:calcium-dependent protein kinase